MTLIEFQLVIENFQALPEGIEFFSPPCFYYGPDGLTSSTSGQNVFNIRDKEGNLTTNYILYLVTKDLRFRYGIEFSSNIDEVEFMMLVDNGLKKFQEDIKNYDFS